MGDITHVSQVAKSLLASQPDQVTHPTPPACASTYPPTLKPRPRPLTLPPCVQSGIILGKQQDPYIYLKTAPGLRGAFREFAFKWYEWTVLGLVEEEYVMQANLVIMRHAFGELDSDGSGEVPRYSLLLPANA